MPDTAATPDKERLIHPAHLTGSALAAGAATAAASYFGVAGTIIGAVAASVVATVVSATSTHSLKKWPKLGLFGAAVLVIVMGAVTGVEGIAGRPLSSLMGGSTASTGTTIGRSVTTPIQERTIVKKVVIDNTVTPSPTPAPTTPTPTSPGEPPSKLPQTQAPAPKPTSPATPSTPDSNSGTNPDNAPDSAPDPGSTTAPSGTPGTS